MKQRDNKNHSRLSVSMKARPVLRGVDGPLSTDNVVVPSCLPQATATMEAGTTQVTTATGGPLRRTMPVTPTTSTSTPTTSIRPTTTISQTTTSPCVSSGNRCREWLLLEIVRGYFNARKNKRNTASQSLFESDLLLKLWALFAKIISLTYEVSRSIAFIIVNTVMREVFAAQFVDRIVHHILYNWLAPIFEPLFIYDSYSCRKGKGTDFGVNRLRHHIRSVSQNGTRPCWVLQLDLSGYFMSITRQKLYDIIVGVIKRKHIDRKPEWFIIDFLLKKVIFNEPTKGCRIKGKKTDWIGLPKNKSLFLGASRMWAPDWQSYQPAF